jgi:Transposase, Mutator family.
LKYEIEDMNVPRDREGKFITGIFNPYARSIGIDELIISLYSNGIIYKEGF